MDADAVGITLKWSVFGGLWSMKISKSRITSACRNYGSEYSTMWISTTPVEFTRHCNTTLRMKSISAFAIQQTEVILVQVRLHRSFRKSCPAKGARRTESPAQHENFSYWHRFRPIILVLEFAFFHSRMYFCFVPHWSSLPLYELYVQDGVYDLLWRAR